MSRGSVPVVPERASLCQAPPSAHRHRLLSLCSVTLPLSQIFSTLRCLLSAISDCLSPSSSLPGRRVLLWTSSLRGPDQPSPAHSPFLPGPFVATSIVYLLSCPSLDILALVCHSWCYTPRVFGIGVASPSPFPVVCPSLHFVALCHLLHVALLRTEPSCILKRLGSWHFLSFIF